MRGAVFCRKAQRWKYDFLSVFLCIVLMVSAFGGACLMAAFDFALHREEFWIEYDARQERDLTDEESDRLRLDLDEGTGPDLDDEMRTAARPPTRKCEPYKKHITAIQKIPFTGGTCPGILNVHPDDGCSKKKV